MVMILFYDYFFCSFVMLIVCLFHPHLILPYKAFVIVVDLI